MGMMSGGGGGSGGGNSKQSTAGVNTGQPAWGGGGNAAGATGPAPAPGTQAYNDMNTQLQTAPMQAAVNMFQNGGMSPQMAGLMSMFMGGTGTNANMNNAASTFGGIAGGNPQFQDWANQSMGVANSGSGLLGQYAAGSADPGTINAQNYQNLYNQAGGPTSSGTNLADMASGKLLQQGGNPYMDKMVADSQQDVANQTNALFASGGRYGSGAHQGTVSDSVARTGNELRNANYEAERGRQLQANQMIDSAKQGMMGLGLQAAGGVSGIEGQNIANRLQGLGQAANITNSDIANRMGGLAQAGNLTNMNTQNQLAGAQGLGGIGQNQYANRQNDWMQAAGLGNQGMQNQLGLFSQLGNIQNNKVFDANQQQQVGGQIDTRTQQGLDDLIKQWQGTDMQDWARLGGLLSASTGAAGNWGTQNTTSQQPMNILGALGTLMSGFG